MNAFKKAQIIGGNFQDSSGVPLSNGYLMCTLSHDSNVAVLGGPTGSQVVAGLTIRMQLDNNGSLCQNQYLWTNDNLTPSGSYYTVTAFNNQGIQVWAFPQIFTFAPYSPTIDIGTLQPQIP